MKQFEKQKEPKEPEGIDFFLDITDEVCPLTFVKTKLMIEKMTPGQVAEVRLKGAEPLENVPRSVREQGDTVLSLEPLESAGGGDPGDDVVHRLLIRREAGRKKS